MTACGCGSTVSCAVTVMVIGISLWLGGQRMSCGDASMLSMTGGVVSRTVTVKEPEALLPCASVAVQLTVVVPSAKTPEAGEQTGVTAPSTMSVAVSEAV